MIIFSAELSSLSARENLERTAEAQDVLGSCTVGTGVYKGVSESCFITNKVLLGQALAVAFDQECYLERGHYGIWYLIDTKTSSIIDTFKTIKEVSKEKAEKLDNYTVLNGKYYVGSKY